MDEIRGQFHDGRTAMVEAFKELIWLALQAGADWEAVGAQPHQFWTGNAAVKRSFGTATLIAELRKPT